uniref:Branched-chain amino acid aminotransferase n=1 Tax=Gongylonema pulchrum TaxID=637853 RepID=A0A183DIY8_9BILA
LVTAPLTDGLILPGITRDSVLCLARQMQDLKVTERYVGMEEVRKATKEKRVRSFSLQIIFHGAAERPRNRIHEIFGTGTACVVMPVGRILYKNKDANYDELVIPSMSDKTSLMQKFYDAIVDI